MPGGYYTLTAVTSAGAVSATLQAPGGGVSLSPDRTTLTWDYDGNRDFYWVDCRTFPYHLYLSGEWTSDISSPATIPSSEYPIAGEYWVTMFPQNILYSVPGAVGSSFTIWQGVTTTFSYPP